MPGRRLFSACEIHSAVLRGEELQRVLSQPEGAGTKEGAVKWIIRPTVTKDWRYAPVVQASQVGYHPGQKKVAVIELDKRDTDFKQPALYRIAADGL